MTLTDISFLTSSDGTLWVRLHYRDRGVDGQLDFSHSVGHQLAASVLRDALQEQRHDLIVGIRKAEYAAGWKDKAAKRKKREWFSGSMRREAVA